jgi:YebC/PmpR family DNA-binding regulatory protein
MLFAAIRVFPSSGPFVPDLFRIHLSHPLKWPLPIITTFSFLMAGHNKWSKVKHIKARVDAIKGRVFSKCAHEIALAARAGGGDPAANSRLRSAIDNAKAVSMPKENIDRAIKKGTGELGGESIQEISYEGYGPAGTAFIIEMATDNLNRVAADIRLIFAKNGGSVATPGSVSYQFDRKGEIRINAADITGDLIMEAAIEAGAEDVQSDEDEHVVLTAANELGTVANRLRAAGLKPTTEKLVSLSQTPCIVSDLTVARQILKLHDLLDDYPDTLNVFTNFEVADEILDRLAS